jgi:putative transcriptional regulator
MQRYDGLSLEPIPTYSSAKIRALRARHKLSQAVFATVLNIIVSIVRQWEVGDKQSSGPSLNLLSLLDRTGLEVLI